MQPTHSAATPFYHNKYILILPPLHRGHTLQLYISALPMLPPLGYDKMTALLTEVNKIKILQIAFILLTTHNNDIAQKNLNIFKAIESNTCYIY